MPTNTETLPGTPIATPEPAAAPAEVKPAGRSSTKGTTTSSRPTTRAGRKAAAEARRAGTVKTDSAPKAPTKTDVKASVAQLHELGAVGLNMFGLPMTGAAVEASAADAGEAWAQVCRRYPAVEKFFGAGTDGLVLFRLASVYVPIVLVAVTEVSTPKDSPSTMAQASAMFSAMAQPATTPPDGQNTGGRP